MSSLTTSGLKGIPISLEQTTIPAGNTLRVLGNIDMSSNTGALQLPVGTTAERPASPAVGYMRWNTSTTAVEYWDGSAWTNL